MVILGILFVAASTVLGFTISKAVFPSHVWIATSLFLLASLFIIISAKELQKLSMEKIVGISIGLFSGIILSFLITISISATKFKPSPSLTTLIFISLSYFLIHLSYRKADDIYHLIHPKKERKVINYKVLDTSAIIDGRIADICDTGFIEGVLLIPQFVLHEVQHIADSTDPVKRARGRRGLDILRRIQTQSNVPVEIKDIDFPRIKEVDAKIVATAKRFRAKIITTDYNLNKVAQLQGIQVLNINELASALRPVVLPGEEMKLKIIREGKEEGQGVGYMEDGTMVVVEDGAKRIGEELNVVVTSILQTPAGRIIFTKIK